MVQRVRDLDGRPAAPVAETFVTVSAGVPAEAAEVELCDACGAALPAPDDDEGYDVPGQGIYMWTRGDVVRFEKAPLCAECASAIGMTALARWEIEEEEG